MLKDGASKPRWRAAERAHGDDGEMRSQAGVRVHVCEGAEPLEHNEAAFFFSLSQSRRDADDKAAAAAAARKSLMNAALHQYSDTSVPVPAQEGRTIMNVHAEASGCWLLIIFLAKRNVFPKLTKTKNQPSSATGMISFV